MRNKWFPARVADYVPVKELKYLKSRETDMTRDFAFGVRENLEEADEEEQIMQQPKHYVRPIEIRVLSVRYCLITSYSQC